MFTSSLLAARKTENAFTTIDGIIGSSYTLCLNTADAWKPYFVKNKKWTGTFGGEDCPDIGFSVVNTKLLIEYVCEHDKVVFATGNVVKRLVLLKYILFINYYYILFAKYLDPLKKLHVIF